MGKARRLVELISRVNTGKKYTVQQLADEFGVSYRTMLRDLQELSVMGVPLYSETGIHGGYQVLPKDKNYGIADQKPVVQTGKRINKKEFKVVGLEFVCPYTMKSEAEVLIPRLWFKLGERMESIHNVINPDVHIGVSYYREKDFIYYVSVEVKDFDNIPQDMVPLTIPTKDYILFTHKGVMERGNISDSYTNVSNWIIDNGYNRDFSFNLEIYDERYKPLLVENEFDIYIPLIT